MSRIQANRVSAVGRTIFLLALIWALSGCEGKKESEPMPQPASQAMVPATVDSVTTDTTGAAVEIPEHPTGTSEADGVHPAGSGSEAVTRPREEPATEAVSGLLTRAKVSAGTGTYSLQLGSFRSAANARAEVERIATLGRRPEVEVATLGGQTYHRVVISGLADRAEAERLGEIIRSRLGITYLIRQK